jgi:hypothetical protein
MSRRNHPSDSLILGIVLTVALHIVALIVYVLAIVLLGAIASSLSYPAILQPIIGKYNFLLPLLFPGISQLVYIVPFAVWLWRLGRLELMKGVIIAAVITFLLNGACYLWIFGNVWFR